MKVNEHWKELRPQIGAFVSELDGLYKGAENMDEALTKAEFKGYQKGYEEDKKNICNSCDANAFYRNCNGYLTTIDTFMELSDKSKEIVKRLIYQLSLLEQKGK